LKELQTAGMGQSRRGNGRESTHETREQMKAVSRFNELLLAGALALVPSAALAQQAPPPEAETPATDSIGPRDLQNFSLNGTVTRPADRPAVTQPAPQRPAARSQGQSAPPAVQSDSRTAPATEARSASAPGSATRQTASSDVAPSAPQAARPAEPLRQSPPASSVTVALPSLGNGTKTVAAAGPASSAGDFAPEPATGTLGPEHSFPILPWLLAALVLGAGGAFLFWRNRTREAFAGGPQVDAFVAPTPVPAPAPRPSPAPPAAAPRVPTPASVGVVSTRLRPWIDIAFQPLRCVLHDDRVVVEFEIELFNSGSGPARGVLIEASLFNAGPAQDQEIGAFFSNPVGKGERIVSVPPLKRIGIKTEVAVPRELVQAYELGGRQVFVPLIAFNALYGWSSGEGQTSAAYLLGRDTKSEKLGPFRLDLGPHIFRGVAARLLPIGVRR
jgi:hypothetical protein